MCLLELMLLEIDYVKAELCFELNSFKHFLFVTKHENIFEKSQNKRHFRSLLQYYAHILCIFCYVIPWNYTYSIKKLIFSACCKKRYQHVRRTNFPIVGHAQSNIFGCYNSIKVIIALRLSIV